MERQTGTKLGPQTEHSHLLEHTEQTQQQEITQTNQQKHLLQQQTSQNTHTESNRLQQTFCKQCKTCYQNNKQESRQTDKETTLRTDPHFQPPNNTSHKRHQNNNLTGPDNVNIRHLKHLG